MNILGLFKKKRHWSVYFALGFLGLGLVLLVGALRAAYLSGPSVPQLDAENNPVVADGKPVMLPVDDIGPQACATAAGAAQDPGGDAFRLIEVHPRKTEIGRHMCLVVAGVVPEAVVSSARSEIEKRTADLAKAQQELGAAEAANPPTSTSQLEKLRKSVTDAETALDNALASQRAPVSLTLYLNNAKVPIPVMAQRTSVKQPLYVELAAPDSAAHADAKYWRDLVRGVARRDGSFGEVELAVGMSRTAGAADVPETGASAEHVVTLFVFSLPPIRLGLGSLGSLLFAFGFYAYGAPILRDNSLTRAMLPSELDAAKLGLEDALAKQAKARKDLEDARVAGPVVDATIIAAAGAASAAVNQARNRIARIIAALGKSPDEYKQAQDAVDKAGKDLEAATATGGTADALSTAEVLRAQAVGQLKALSGLAAAPADTAAQNLDRAMDDLVKKTEAAEKARGAVVAAGTDQSLRAAAGADLRTAETARAGAERALLALPLPAGVDLTGPLKTFADSAKAAEDAKIAYRPVEDALEVQKGALHKLSALDAAPSGLDEKAIGSYSLGRTQMAFWLFLVVAAYVFIAMSIGQIYGIFTDPVLYLMGISAVTSAGAMFLSSSSSENRVSRNFIADILSADDAVQLQRLQAVIFTLVLGGVFFYVVAFTFSMPVYDPIQLTLMGLFNGLYVGLKFQDQS